MKRYKRPNYNDFGLSNVVLNNINNFIKTKQFKSSLEIINLIDKLSSALQESKTEFIETFNNVSTCEHSYASPSFTLQGRLLGYVYVYKRYCSLCSFEEIEQCKEEKDKPDWAQGAVEKYYNNL